jgi:hypothetical protein
VPTIVPAVGFAFAGLRRLACSNGRNVLKNAARDSFCRTGFKVRSAEGISLDEAKAKLGINLPQLREGDA